MNFHSTIQPGLIFSQRATAFLRLQWLDDDRVAADIDAIESGATSPAEMLRAYLARSVGHRGWSTLARSYVRAVCSAADVEMTAGI